MVIKGDCPPGKIIARRKGAWNAIKASRRAKKWLLPKVAAIFFAVLCRFYCIFMPECSKLEAVNLRYDQGTTQAGF